MLGVLASLRGRPLGLLIIQVIDGDVAFVFADKALVLLLSFAAEEKEEMDQLI